MRPKSLLKRRSFQRKVISCAVNRYVHCPLSDQALIYVMTGHGIMIDRRCIGPSRTGCWSMEHK